MVQVIPQQTPSDIAGQAFTGHFLPAYQKQFDQGMQPFFRQQQLLRQQEAQMLGEQQRGQRLQSLLQEADRRGLSYEERQRFMAQTPEGQEFLERERERRPFLGLKERFADIQDFIAPQGGAPSQQAPATDVPGYPPQQHGEVEPQPYTLSGSPETDELLAARDPSYAALLDARINAQKRQHDRILAEGYVTEATQRIREQGTPYVESSAQGLGIEDEAVVENAKEVWGDAFNRSKKSGNARITEANNAAREEMRRDQRMLSDLKNNYLDTTSPKSGMFDPSSKKAKILERGIREGVEKGYAPQIREQLGEAGGTIKDIENLTDVYANKPLIKTYNKSLKGLAEEQQIRGLVDLIHKQPRGHSPFTLRANLPDIKPEVIESAYEYVSEQSPDLLDTTTLNLASMVGEAPVWLRAKDSENYWLTRPLSGTVAASVSETAQEPTPTPLGENINTAVEGTLNVLKGLGFGAPVPTGSF